MDEIEQRFAEAKSAEFSRKVLDGLFNGWSSLTDTVGEISNQGQRDLAIFMQDNPFAREAVKEHSDHPSQTMALMAIALEICTHQGD